MCVAGEVLAGAWLLFFNAFTRNPMGMRFFSIELVSRVVV